MQITFFSKPGPSGRNYTSRISFGVDWTQEELDALVSGVCGTPPDKCAEIFGEYLHQFLQAATPRRAFKLFGGQLNVKPSTGGTAATPDGFHTAEDLKADVSLSYAADVIHDWRATCTIEKVGDEGVAIPIVETIINCLTGTPNTYTAAQAIHLQLENGGFNKLMPNQGVFSSTGENGPWVRINAYGSVSDKNIYAFIPAATTGGLRVKVVNEAGHEFVYTVVLSSEQPPP